MVPLRVKTFVAQAVCKSGPAYPQVYLIRYMDDIILAEKAQGRLLAACAHLRKDQLLSWNDFQKLLGDSNRLRPY